MMFVEERMNLENDEVLDSDLKKYLHYSLTFLFFFFFLMKSLSSFQVFKYNKKLFLHKLCIN